MNQRLQMRAMAISSPSRDDLRGRVCVVAGATRGAGRGIAVGLGERGATVVCTGRSVRGGPPATAGRTETIDDTADLVTRAGGRGLALRVDHARPEEVVELAARVVRDHGRVDVLVDDIWGGDALAEWSVPFWEQSLETGRALLETGLFTHIHTLRAFAPVFVRQRSGLVVEIGDGHTLAYRDCFFYDLVKHSVLRLAYAASEELRPHGVTALAVTPGFLRSEAMLDHFGVTEASWRDAVAKDPHFAESETPLFVGRCVAALAADPAIASRTGRSLASGLLAEEYGIVDADGRKPSWPAYFEKTFPDRVRTVFP